MPYLHVHVYSYLISAIIQIVSTALKNLTGEFAGKYYPLAKMTEAEQDQLINVST